LSPTLNTNTIWKIFYLKLFLTSVNRINILIENPVKKYDQQCKKNNFINIDKIIMISIVNTTLINVN